MKLITKFLTITLAMCLTANIYGQVYPQQNGSRYSLSYANIYFEVDAGRGTKVSSLKVDGNEYLFNDSTVNFYGQYIYWGSTVWLAPETENKWPPFANIDNGIYTDSIVDDTIMMFESKNERDKERDFYSLKKRFWISTYDTAIVLEYTVSNNNADPHKKAIWEPTRIKPHGMTFWAKDTEPWPSPITTIADISDKPVINGDYYWLDFDNTIDDESKFYTNTGEGWFAHVNDSNQLFIKTYENIDTTEVAPGEDEMLYWVALNHQFIELENQSRYVEIPANGTSTYRLKWYLRTLPKSMDVSAGSNELLTYTKRITDKAANDNMLYSFSNDTPQTPDIIAFPNPATDHIYFNLTTQAMVNIYSLSGSVLLSDNVNNNEPINISELGSGVYIYKIVCNNIVYTGKFVKE